jgi:hypothetical protein
MTTTLRALLVLAALALPAAAQKGTFIITKGKDTVAVESFSRDAVSLTSQIAHSSGVRWQITATLRPDSAVQSVEAMRQGRTPAASLTMNVNFADTLVAAQASAAQGSDNISMPVRERAMPFLALSFALTEQIVQASHLAPGKSRQWMTVRLGAVDTATVTVTRFHPDSISVKAADMDLKLALSPAGVVVGARHLGQDWLVERRSGK